MMTTGLLFRSDFAPRLLSVLCSISLRLTSVVIPVYSVLSLHFAIYTYQDIYRGVYAEIPILSGYSAPPRGIEPLSLVPKTSTLSVELRRLSRENLTVSSLLYQFFGSVAMPCCSGKRHSFRPSLIEKRLFCFSWQVMNPYATMSSWCPKDCRRVYLHYFGFPLVLFSFWWTSTSFSRWRKEHTERSQR